MQIKQVKPVIQQLKFKWIEQEIRQLAKTMPRGSKLPSERSFAESYKCNFPSIQAFMAANAWIWLIGLAGSIVKLLTE